MLSYVAMWLEGPLQSYAGEDCLYDRETLSFPSRSAITGMLFFTLGWTGEERERYRALSGLRLVVYGYSKSSTRASKLVDFQMVGDGYDVKDKWQERMVPHRADGGPVAGGISSCRPITKHYLQDAVFSAVLAIPQSWSSEVLEASRKPKHPIFLGRKACMPVTPVVLGVEQTSERALGVLESFKTQRNRVFAPVSELFDVRESDEFESALGYRLRDVPLCGGDRPDYGWRQVLVLKMNFLTQA